MTAVASPEAIEAARAAAQDDETRGYQRLAEPIARRLIIKNWRQVYRADDGLGCWDQPTLGQRVIHSIARELDGDVWAHVSLSRRTGRMPTWTEVRDIWRLFYPDVAGVVVIPAASNHVSIAEVAHIWGNLNRPAVPDFSHGLGTI